MPYDSHLVQGDDDEIDDADSREQGYFPFPRLLGRRSFAEPVPYFKVNDRLINDANDLMNFIASIRPGTTANLSVIGEGKTVTEKVQIAKPKEEEAGIPAPHSFCRWRHRESRASGGPLSPQLLEKFGIPEAVKQGLEEFRTLMSRTGKGKNVLLLVSRHGSTFCTTISEG